MHGAEQADHRFVGRPLQRVQQTFERNITLYSARGLICRARASRRGLTTRTSRALRKIRLVARRICSNALRSPQLPRRRCSQSTTSS